MKKKIFYALIKCLPQPLRHSYYRKKFARVPTSIPKNLTFELARSKADLEAAFKLLHDAYVEQGFIGPDPSGMRLILQHALPTTSVLVAKYEDRVVGTISVMRDNPLGLPMEKVFDLSELRKEGRRMAELSCLAIHPDYRRKMGGDIFFPLTIFAARFSEESFGADDLVWNLYPHHADFYNGIFGSSHLTKASKDYLGAPATAIHVDLRRSYAFAKEHYEGLSPEKDLFAYAYKINHPYFNLPSVIDGRINHPVLCPEKFKYFFKTKTPLLDRLSPLEEQVLVRYYPVTPYEKIFPLRSQHPERKEERWDVKIHGICESERALFLDISASGFKAYISTEPEFDKKYFFVIPLSNKILVEIKASLVWKDKNRSYGFRIDEVSEEWKHLISQQKDALMTLAS